MGHSRQGRHLVDDHLGLRPRDRLTDGARVESIHQHGLGAQGREATELVGAAGGRDDVVAALGQLTHQLPSDHTACACNEDTHRDLLLLSVLRQSPLMTKTDPRL
jgi:hypothetical protein